MTTAALKWLESEGYFPGEPLFVEVCAVLLERHSKRDQRIIKALSEALDRHTEAIEQMTIDHVRNCICVGCAALALAKEAQND